jgi:hypothetical protein
MTLAGFGYVGENGEYPSLPDHVTMFARALAREIDAFDKAEVIEETCRRWIETGNQPPDLNSPPRLSLCFYGGMRGMA